MRNRQLKKRVRQVISSNGAKVQNIWFIPHYMEVLAIYKHLDDVAIKLALTRHLTIVSALHDILQYLCAHARLGTAHARMGSRNNTNTNTTIPADWGGMEGIGTLMLQKSYYRLWWHGGYRWLNASEVIL